MEDLGKLLLRVTTAGLILFHGIHKIIFGIAFIGQGLAAMHLPAFIAYGVFLGEVVAPLFMIVGLWARYASLVVVFNLIMAILLEAHRNVLVVQRTGAWGLEAEAFFLLTALVVFLVGAGRYAITKERRPTAA